MVSLQKELTSKRTKIHGKRHTKLYYVWRGIKTRCYNKHSKKYDVYGWRGIAVCDEWRNDFMNFYDWAINNGYKDGLTIDRIDVDGNYEPSNCRWATQKQQQRNRRNNRKVTINGETHCLTEWCEILGINNKTVYSRISRNWSIERALELKGAL